MKLRVRQWQVGVHSRLEEGPVIALWDKWRFDGVTCWDFHFWGATFYVMNDPYGLGK